MLGINLSGAEFGKGHKFGWDYTYPTLKDLTFYAEKGLTLARLPVKWERLQPELGGELDAAEVGRLKLFLDNAAKTGMQIIVDVHNYGRYKGKVIGSEHVSVADFADFWSKMADAIGSKPALLGYDLMNEPHGMPNKMVWPQAAQAATDAIRALGDTHTIFVEGEQWASAAAWEKANPNLDVRDPLNKIVYEAHVYFDRDSTGTYKGTYDQEKAYPDIGEKRIQSFVSWLEKKGAQGFIGEFAVPSDDPRWQVVLDNFLVALNKYGLSGTYWGAGPWFGDYKMGLADKKGNAKASLDTLVKHVEDNADLGLAANRRQDDHAAEPGAATDGDDVLAGTPTLTRFDGKLGEDLVDFSAATGPVTARLDGVRFVSIEHLTGGSGDDALTGDAKANRLSGGKGNDVLDGGAGADVLTGGAGNDVFHVDSAGDTVVERAGEGRDTVVATLSWTLGANLEDLKLVGAGAMRGTGNDGANKLTGNGGATFLFGLGGDDELDGGAGDDRLEGGAGADKLIGGSGADWFEGGAGSDVLTGGAGADLFFFDRDLAGGKDRVTDFGADDFLVTAVKFRDGNNDGVISAGKGKAFDFAQGGSVSITAANGSTVTALRYDGSYKEDGVEYFVYSLSGKHSVADFGARMDGYDLG